MFKDLSKSTAPMYCGCSSGSAGGDAACGAGDGSGSGDGSGPSAADVAANQANPNNQAAGAAGQAAAAEAAAQIAAATKAREAAEAAAREAAAQEAALSFSRSTAAEEAAGMTPGFSFAGPDSSLTSGFDGGYGDSSNPSFPGIQALAREKGISFEEAKGLVDEEVEAREASKKGNPAPTVDLSQPLGIDISQRAIDNVSDLMAVGKDKEAEALSGTYAESYTGVPGYVNRAVDPVLDYVEENPFATVAAPFTMGMSLAPGMALSAAARGLDSYGVRGETAEEAMNAATYGALTTGGQNLGANVGANVGYGIGGIEGAMVGAIGGAIGGHSLGSDISADIAGGSLSGNTAGGGTTSSDNYGGFVTDGQGNPVSTISGNLGYGGIGGTDYGSSNTVPVNAPQQPVEQPYMPYQPYVPSYSSLQNTAPGVYSSAVEWVNGSPYYRDNKGSWTKFAGY